MRPMTVRRPTDRPSPTEPPSRGLVSLGLHAVTAVVAALVALVTHHLAYLSVHPLTVAMAGPDRSHAHIDVQWALITPLAVVLTGAFVVRQIRTLGLTPSIGARPLAILAGSFFVVQEAIESLVATGDLSAMIGHPATYVGLVLAPVVALVVSRSLHRASELVAQFLAPAPTLWPTVTGRWYVAAEQRWAAARHHGSASPRGPPRLLHT